MLQESCGNFSDLCRFGLEYVPFFLGGISQIGCKRRDLEISRVEVTTDLPRFGFK